MPRSRSQSFLRPWSKKLGRRLRTGVAGGILGELAFYLSLILLGVFVLSLTLVTHFMVPKMSVELPHHARVVLDSELASGGGTWGRLIVSIVSIAAIGSGCFGLGYRLLHLGFSRERLQSSPHLNRSIASGIFRSKSAEDDEGEGKDTDTLEPDEASSSFAELPSIPPSTSIVESPGERLRYRLASASSGRISVIGAASLALLWNAVWVVLLAVVVSGWWYGKPRPILTVLLVPFAMAAYWALQSFLRQVRKIAGVGPTVVEISDQPLQPGGTYQVFISQMGRMRLRKLSVELVCEEESYFREGTDVRSDQHIALSTKLLSESSVRVDPQSPWEQQLEVHLPSNAMHSFTATNNSVRWRLVVSGESRPWPSFCRSFPIVVHPPLLAPPSNPR